MRRWKKKGKVTPPKISGLYLRRKEKVSYSTGDNDVDRFPSRFICVLSNIHSNTEVDRGEILGLRSTVPGVPVVFVHTKHDDIMRFKSTPGVIQVIITGTKITPKSTDKTRIVGQSTKKHRACCWILVSNLQ